MLLVWGGGAGDKDSFLAVVGEHGRLWGQPDTRNETFWIWEGRNP